MRLLKTIIPVIIFSTFTIHAHAKPEENRVKKAHLQAHISVPEALLGKCPTQAKALPKDHNMDGWITYGGDIRVGDLTGNGVPDFVVFRSVGGIKPGYIGAFTWQGEVLWERGDKDRMVTNSKNPDDVFVTEGPTRPGPVAIFDIDGDGCQEVVAMMINETADSTDYWKTDDCEFVVLDGKTGEVKKRSAPPALTGANAVSNGKVSAPNYLHMRILAADFTGKGSPQDFVIKIGDYVMAFDGDLTHLWTYMNKYGQYGKHSSYIPTVGDVDNDGLDEVAGGNYLVDNDGSVMWEKLVGEHNDSVAIVDWDGDAEDGKEVATSGYGTVLDNSGDELIQLGKDEVPHGQELRVARFMADRPGVQMAVRYKGHLPDILIADRQGNIVSRFTVDHSHINVGMEPVYWHGPDSAAYLYCPASLWNGYGEKVYDMPGLPKESRSGRMGWYHCIPAVLDSSMRESVILFDAYAKDIWVYGREALVNDIPDNYQHTERQYNARLMD